MRRSPGYEGRGPSRDRFERSRSGVTMAEQHGRKRRSPWGMMWILVDRITYPAASFCHDPGCLPEQPCIQALPG